MRIFQLFGLGSSLVLALFFTHHAQANNIEPGIYFTGGGYLQSVVIEDDAPPVTLWQGEQVQNIHCRFISPKHLELFPATYQAQAKD